MELAFLGGATTVTGSQFLLTAGGARVLFDCGMFQGSPNETERNRLPFAFEARDIDALILTHAHLDHCGMIPALVADGFAGPIYATAATAELAGLVLMDSAKLQSEFARRAIRRDERRRGHKVRPARDLEHEIRASPPEVRTEIEEPLYDESDVLAALARFRPVGYGAEFAVNGVSARLRDAGHILGSAIVEVRAENRTLVFSGDLGRRSAPIVNDPTTIRDADYVVMESTYGGREHQPEKISAEVLAETVHEVSDAGGVLLVPAFAIGRTQDLVWELDKLLDAHRVPPLPLYLDSPMASKATEIYRRHRECFDDEMRAVLAHGADPLDYPHAQVTNDVAASRAIRERPRPYMIVASNGMLTGGRVLAHLRDLIDDPAATLLFVGYQGEGTLGAHLQSGVRRVVIDGAEREVRCRVRSIDGFSAHADEPQLLDWLGGFTDGKRAGDVGFPRQVFVVHGDPEAQRALAPKVAALGLVPRIPQFRERVSLD
jgi:metallo-beta-lactamase family protein